MRDPGRRQARQEMRLVSYTILGVLLVLGVAGVLSQCGSVP